MAPPPRNLSSQNSPGKLGLKVMWSTGKELKNLPRLEDSHSVCFPNECTFYFPKIVLCMMMCEEFTSGTEL